MSTNAISTDHTGGLPGHPRADSEGYDCARLRLTSVSMGTACILHLSESLEGGPADRRGIAYTAAGGAAENVECLYTLTGDGASWNLVEYAATTPPQDTTELGALTEVPEAAELRTLALNLPTGYASMTCHDVAVTDGTVFVLAEVSDTSFLIPVDIATWTEGAEFDVEDPTADRGALGVSGAGRLLLACVVSGALRVEEYSVSGGVPTLEGISADLSVEDTGTPLEALGVDAVPGSSGGDPFLIGVVYLCARTTAGTFVYLYDDTGVDPPQAWALTSYPTLEVRAITYDAARGIWHGDVGSDPVFTILCREVS